MKFEPVEHPPSCPPSFQDAVASNIWMPQCSHPCTFDAAMFVEKMMNIVLNPNLNSTWLFRADILYDDTDADADADADAEADSETVPPITHDVLGMKRYRTLVRRLIPRNEKRDRPLDQTCAFYSSSSSSAEDSTTRSTLIIYSPHASPDDIPYYHPKVRGIAHLHQWNPSSNQGTISIHFLPFMHLDPVSPAENHPPAFSSASPEETLKLQRTAYHLLQTINKHGHATDYVKRVQHDIVVPRRRFQERYALLKSRYAKRLVDSWAENTDPAKHVFEDLGIAAFLIELWEDMYPPSTSTGTGFPGFVDMACGNGLLVYILNQEGYAGYGFDARRRKSWANYASSSDSLQERLLLPSLLSSSQHSSDSTSTSSIPLHDGLFPKNTFLISNHGDELTPWTPLLASLSHCPFIVIPCCSHNFAGERFRAPPPRDKTRPKSAYASLVDWVARIAEDCGWLVETEMLRIPSTRNTCLLGRTRTSTISGAQGLDSGVGVGVVDEASALALIERYGGVGGYYEAVLKLVKAAPRGH